MELITIKHSITLWGWGKIKEHVLPAEMTREEAFKHLSIINKRLWAFNLMNLKESGNGHGFIDDPDEPVQSPRHFYHIRWRNFLMKRLGLKVPTQQEDDDLYIHEY